MPGSDTSVSKVKPIGLRHLALRVRDLRAMEGFYVGLLGFEVEWRPDPDNLYLTLRGDSLALHRADTIAPRGSLDHLGIAYATARDVDITCQGLAAAGTRMVEPPRQHRDGAYSATVVDPEGNHLQLICHPPIVAFEQRKS
jgi:catechol 2,3-dioxygenase-like lactoylglutathione lyase family enzyme